METHLLVSILLRAVILVLADTAGQEAAPSGPSGTTCFAPHGPHDYVTHKGPPVSSPHSTYTYFEAAKSLPQCYISEQLLEDYQRLVHVYHQLATASLLCILLALVIAAIAIRSILRRPAQTSNDTCVPPRAGPRNGTVAAAPLRSLAQPSDPAPMGTSSASTPKRGKSSSVGEITSALSSNTAQGQAQSASAHVDPDQPLIMHEPQSDELNGIATDDTEHTQKPAQNTTGPKRGSSNALHQSSPPAIDRARLGLLQPTFYRPFTFLVDRFKVIFSRYWPIPQLGDRPLLRSLHGYGPAFSIFAIAGDNAERDIHILYRALTHPYATNARFVSLSRYTTLDNIKNELRGLYNECKNIPNTHLFIYLTSHGDWHNNMIISGYEALSETHLFELLSEPTIPVTILFDICRKGIVPSVSPPKGISLIWACSLGERAIALRVRNNNVPHSCFLIALMMSARTPGLQCTSEALKEMIQWRLHQLILYLREAHALTHPAGRCLKCMEIPKPCDKPTRQKIDWEHAEANGLLELTKILSDSDIAEEVYQRFMGDPIFLRVNNSDPKALRSIGPEGEGSESLAVAVAPITPPDFGPPLEDHTSRHERGVNELVHALSTLTLG
ncbi:unnamed protein product [Rhizoctonia solani]|uniref:Uncharacterized protein n=1 Tax=Rhizoctonia solani TaxID=456999 RepID=A0A8H2WC07_9AGAM|nr:unnamed protein product [Rhizoctonia solani]